MSDTEEPEEYNERAEEINWAEHSWLQYPTSRQYQPSMAQFIINNGKCRNTLEYMGAYYIPLAPSYAKKFLKKGNEDINFDVIYMPPRKPGKKRRKLSSKNVTEKFGRRQSIFANLETFAQLRRPTKKAGVYFFGEVHDTSGVIQWNVAFLCPSQGTMYFFDPAMDTSDDVSYDFFSRHAIVNAFSNAYGKPLELLLLKARQKPQYVCTSGVLGVDRFCQTWVLMFLDVFCNDKEKEFLQLRFKKYQTMIVKTWVICLLKKIERVTGDTNIVDSDPQLKNFPYCMRRDESGLIIEGKPLVCPVVDNCVDFVIERFST
jgi:hypothetical protein